MHKTLEEKPIILIGDVHGDWHFLREFAIKFPEFNVIQLGDFGMGYMEPSKQHFKLDNLSKVFEKANSHLYVIRGNHDDPKYFDDRVINDRITFLRDYSVLTTYNGDRIQLVGGGISVDRKLREENKGWWKGEKIVFSPVKIEKVDCFLSHVPPKNFILDKFQTNGFVDVFCKEDLTLREELKEEQELMQNLFDLSQANLSYFGHMHVDTSCVDGFHRRYRCVDINEALELLI